MALQEALARGPVQVVYEFRGGRRRHTAVVFASGVDTRGPFFTVHDPTTMDRQGNDVGASYRSAIFYTSPEQKAAAEDTIADVNASKLWPGKVVTEVSAAGDFWEAEPEHQDYLIKHPGGYTCHWVRPNWVLPRRASVAAE